MVSLVARQQQPYLGDLAGGGLIAIVVGMVGSSAAPVEPDFFAVGRARNLKGHVYTSILNIALTGSIHTLMNLMDPN